MGTGTREQWGVEKVYGRSEKRGREPGEIGKNFCNTVQYFAKGKARRGGKHYGRGWEP